MSAPVAVLVMSYGTPASREEIEAYYTDVRGGRPPSPEQLADLVRRYEAIGGASPLAERTAEQVASIGRALEELAPGAYEVTSGTKHGAPRIESAVDALAERGASDLVGVVLAPHYSAMSIGDYIARADGRARRHGLRSGFVESWHDDPELVALLAERLEQVLDEGGEGGAIDEGSQGGALSEGDEGDAIDEGREGSALDTGGALGEGGAGGALSEGSAGGALGKGGGETVVVFTAHSLPQRTLTTGDPYASQLAETARLVATRCHLDERHIGWQVGWQSAGRTPEPWIGPDILQLLRDLAGAGTRRVVVVPAGFTADHLEVLYDLDVEARRLAGELGIAFARTASLNNDPRLAALIARRVAATAPRAPDQR